MNIGKKSFSGLKGIGKGDSDRRNADLLHFLLREANELVSLDSQVSMAQKHKAVTASNKTTSQLILCPSSYQSQSKMHSRKQSRFQSSAACEEI